MSSIRKLFNLPHTSRIHRLKSFPPKCYVKRDDELSFGISGSKIRKYISLFPKIIEEKKQVLVCGSKNSNHVLGMTQLLIENEIKFKIFLIGEKSITKKGNEKLLHHFVDEENIFYIKREDWPNHLNVIKNLIGSQEFENSMYIPEGASCAESLVGALTLTNDIIRNENENGIKFKHLFLDSGTGFMAAATIVGLSFLGRDDIFVHVIKIVNQSDEDFLKMVNWLKDEHYRQLGQPIKKLIPYKTYLPINLRSFGSTSKSQFRNLREFSKKEGFFTDPIYSFKTFQKSKQIIEEFEYENCLIVHSGGALSLVSGFQEFL